MSTTTMTGLARRTMFSRNDIGRSCTSYTVTTRRPPHACSTSSHRLRPDDRASTSSCMFMLRVAFTRRWFRRLPGPSLFSQMMVRSCPGNSCSTCGAQCATAWAILLDLPTSTRAPMMPKSPGRMLRMLALIASCGQWKPQSFCSSSSMRSMLKSASGKSALSTGTDSARAVTVRMTETSSPALYFSSRDVSAAAWRASSRRARMPCSTPSGTLYWAFLMMPVSRALGSGLSFGCASRNQGRNPLASATVAPVSAKNFPKSSKMMRVCGSSTSLGTARW